MSKRTKPLLLIIISIVAISTMMQTFADARTWTDRTGRHTIEAEFRGLADGTVYLRKPSGDTILVPLEALSTADQEYIRKVIAAHQQVATPSTTPPNSTGSQPAAGAPSWPRWHGADATNVSKETGLMDRWPDGGPQMIWEAGNLGHGFATVAIDNGTIYTTGNSNDATMMTAMDLEGNKKWTANCGPAFTGSFPGTRGTPTIDGDRIYNESPNGDVYCLKAATGEKIWNRNILSDFNGSNIKWALAESVLIDGNNVICCPGGSNGVVALNKMTGETVWATPGVGEKAGYCSPVLAQQQGLRMILTMTAKSLIGVNADNGGLLFKQPHETRYDVNATDPIYHNGMVYVSSGYGTTGSEMYRINVSGRRVSVEKVWSCPELDNKHGGVLLYNGYLYGSGDANARQAWMCLDWRTGEVKWQEKGELRMGSLTCADGMLYTLSEQGQMALVRATPESYQKISQFKVPSGGGGNPHWAHPVVCDGRLYVRHGEKLFVYDIKK